MVSRPAEDYRDENGRRRAGSTECQEESSGAISEGVSTMVILFFF